jgi:tetratricopeptide (TPR) repeat protein
MGIKVVLFILACLALACLLPVSATAESAAMLITKGNELYDGGKFQDAVIAYDESIALDPTQARAWAGKGFALNALQDYTNALASFDQAIAISPNYGKAWYEKGNALYGLKRYEDAIIAYDEAIRVYPEYAYLAYYWKAKSFQALNRNSEALPFYDKALSFKPDYAPAWNSKGETLAALGRYDEAISAFDKALSIAPGYADAAQNRQNMTLIIGSSTLIPPRTSLTATTSMPLSPTAQSTKSGNGGSAVSGTQAPPPPTKTTFPGIIPAVGAVLTGAAVIAIQRSDRR